MDCYEAVRQFFICSSDLDSIEAGILSVCPHCQVVKLSVADGGEGTLAAVCAVRNFRNVTISVSDPLCRRISASYAVLDDGTAVELSAKEWHKVIRSGLTTCGYVENQLIQSVITTPCGCLS